MITDRHTRWHKLNILLLSTEQLSQLYSSLKQTHKTQHFLCKLSTKNMNTKCHKTKSSFLLLRAKLLITSSMEIFVSLCISAKPLSRSSSIVERNRDFRIFMGLKHLSARQEVNGNVFAMRSNFLILTNRVGVVINMPTMDVQDDWVDSFAICSSFISEGWQDLFLYAT